MHAKPLFRQFLLLNLLLMLPQQVIADRPSLSKADGVTVQVRTVHANHLRSGAKKGTPLGIDRRLGDLSSKLRKFQYQDYSLVGSKQEYVGLTSRKVIALQGGHSLAVRPMYIEGKRVGMWLRWQDAHGMKLLDTRMHFNCGVPVVTGTESGDNSGVILAITVQPTDS